MRKEGANCLTFALPQETCKFYLIYLYVDISLQNQNYYENIISDQHVHDLSCIVL